jgi:GntR family transcriptional regulator, phosphonate transport system regulatory protein
MPGAPKPPKTRTPLWQSIATALKSEMAEGHFPPGAKLPTEAELSARFGVNRHTVRQALASLSDSGLTHSRRGSGVFVAARPVDYPLGARVRFHQNLALAGRLPGRKLLSLITRSADATEARALDIAPGAALHVSEGVSFADNEPLAVFRSAFPADRLPGLMQALSESGSITAALKAEGVLDYTRLETRLTATTASATQALHLRLPEGAALIRATSVNIDPSGVPVEYGITWFAGDRVTLVLAGG